MNGENNRRALRSYKPAKTAEDDGQPYQTLGVGHDIQSYLDTTVTGGNTYRYVITEDCFGKYAAPTPPVTVTTPTSGTAMPLSSLLAWFSADQTLLNNPQFTLDLSGNNNNQFLTNPPSITLQGSAARNSFLWATGNNSFTISTPYSSSTPPAPVRPFSSTKSQTTPAVSLISLPIAAAGSFTSQLCRSLAMVVTLPPPVPSGSPGGLTTAHCTMPKKHPPALPLSWTGPRLTTTPQVYSRIRPAKQSTSAAPQTWK
jgi:hypothetical protein